MLLKIGLSDIFCVFRNDILLQFARNAVKLLTISVRGYEKKAANWSMKDLLVIDKCLAD